MGIISGQTESTILPAESVKANCLNQRMLFQVKQVMNGELFWLSEFNRPMGMQPGCQATTVQCLHRATPADWMARSTRHLCL